MPAASAAAQMMRNSGTLGEPAESTSASRGRLRQVGAGGADVRVGVAQRRDQLGQDRRVGGVELLPHAREVDRGVQALVEDVRVADAGGRVGVELEELDVVALQERVEPADAHRAREARLDADQLVLGVGELELVAQARVGRIGVAEAVEHPAQRGHGVLDAAHLAGGDEVRHQHERDRRALEHHVVLVEPALDLGLEVGAAVAELRELDEVLELEVVDVVDQCGVDLIAAPPARRRHRRGGRSTRRSSRVLRPSLNARIGCDALRAPLVRRLAGRGARRPSGRCRRAAARRAAGGRRPGRGGCCSRPSGRR